MNLNKKNCNTMLALYSSYIQPKHVAGLHRDEVVFGL